MAKTGITRPFRFGSDGNPVMSTGDDLRTQRLERVLGTRRAGPRAMGELAWRHYFGSRIELLRLQNMDDTTLALTYVYAVEAVQDAMPDEIVDRVQLDAIDSAGLVDVVVYTRLRGDATKRKLAPTVTVTRR